MVYVLCDVICCNAAPHTPAGRGAKGVTDADVGIAATSDGNGGTDSLGPNGTTDAGLLAALPPAGKVVGGGVNSSSSASAGGSPATTTAAGAQRVLGKQGTTVSEVDDAGADVKWGATWMEQVLEPQFGCVCWFIHLYLEACD
jgi:hypothetical protein